MAVSWLFTVFACIAAATPLLEQDVSGLTERSGSKPRYPFNKIVAFGDDFTDDGRGSYAHGITGNPKTGAGKHMWGHNTFTDGLVAVSYLSKKLDLPVSYNYAWGSSGGAGVLGSICSNDAIPKSKEDSHARYQNELVPSARQQIHNYTNGHKFKKEMKKTLHFFWTGNNDVIASLGWTGRFTICTKDRLCVPSQQKFIKKLNTCFQHSLMDLVNAGAQHILVPNVYPRNLSPWTHIWISKQQGMADDFGNVINEFNARLQKTINKINAKHGTNIMYYDVNDWMKRAMADKTMVQGAAYPDNCVDGCPQTKTSEPKQVWQTFWQTTVVDKKPNPFYWMTSIMPSSTVHKHIAKGMAMFLREKYPKKG